MRKFLTKLNWKFLLVHLLAGSFLIIACSQFAGLKYYWFYEAYFKYGYDELYKHVNPDFSPSNLLIWRIYGYLAGLILYLIFTFLIAWRKKIYWLNPILALIFILILNKTGVYYSDLVKTITYAPGHLLGHPGSFAYFLFNGIILSLASLFLFFSPWTNRFIMTRPGSKLPALAEDNV